jgi:hypothetical protein
MKVDFNADPDLPGHDGEELKNQFWYGGVEEGPSRAPHPSECGFLDLVKHASAQRCEGY